MQQFKKIAFHGNDISQQLQFLQDNVEAWTRQFSQYPDGVLPLEKIRLPRPRYFSLGGTVVTVLAPMTFLINGKIYESSEDIICDLSKSGRGGLLDGVSIAALTPYYLYAHVRGNAIYVSASSKDPDVGLDDEVGPWTYIGACATRSSGGPEFRPFQASGGMLIAEDEFGGVTVAAGSGANQEASFPSMPLTALKAWCQLIAESNGSGAGGTATASGFSTGAYDTLNCMVALNNESAFVHGWLPVFTAQKLYLTASTNVGGRLQFNGWQEEPTRWP